MFATFPTPEAGSTTPAMEIAIPVSPPLTKLAIASVKAALSPKGVATSPSGRSAPSQTAALIRLPPMSNARIIPHPDFSPVLTALPSPVKPPQTPGDSHACR